MGSQSVELVESMSTVESELVASLGLDRAAGQLGAVAVAVLLTEGQRTELTHFWSQTGTFHKHRDSDAQQNLARALESLTGPIDMGDPLAQFLRDWITRDARSFLPFHCRIQGHLVTTLFGFAESVVPHHGFPEVVAERLNLVGVAAWSFREITRLKTNLKIVNSRLANRKVVERAKSVLQTERGLNEEQAYEHLRSTSRRRRIPLSQLAQEVLRTQARGSSLTPHSGQR